MTAELTFNLPEEVAAFRDAQNGAAWKSAVCEMDEWLRTQAKHGNRPDADTLREVRQKLSDLVQERGLALYD